ncbi:hypothetical protein EI94DRAFT_566449 [Lactarius quietus]|nr:hypothetical protein EI94DRAFT_566449 [Lactarius quietus]
MEACVSYLRRYSGGSTFNVDDMARMPSSSFTKLSGFSPADIQTELARMSAPLGLGDVLDGFLAVEAINEEKINFITTVLNMRTNGMSLECHCIGLLHDS